MTKKKTTKRALLSSVIALVLCFTMLLGTTYAWFTDSVTSAGNIIQSGTLKIAMEWKEGEKDLTDADWKDASKTAIFDYDKWEPGFTSARHIRVTNKGSLALKYEMRIVPEYPVNVNGDIISQPTEYDLADVIDVYYYPTAMQLTKDNYASGTKLGTLAEVIDPSNNAWVAKKINGTLEAGSSKMITLALHMREEAGNEYQGLSIGNCFSVQLLATQYTFEEDSFDKWYDKDADFHALGSASPLGDHEVAKQIVIYDEEGLKVGTMIVNRDSADLTASKIEAKVVASDYKGNFTVNTGYETVALDITVDGLVDGNTTPIKVALYIGEDLDPATVSVYHYDDAVTEANYNPYDGYVTFYTATFSPFTLVFDAESKYVAPGTNGPDDLPKADVKRNPELENTDLPWGSYGGFSPTEGLDSQLEAAYTFSCFDTPAEASASPYANWYCDFYVMLDRDLGENQIFLGGNYGDFGWVGFHNGDITLEANTEIPLLGSVTSNPWSYESIASFVGTFICGVGDVNNALAGATFTVMLRLTNPENEAQFYNVATIEHTFSSTADVKVSTAGELQDALDNAVAGTAITFANDITGDVTVSQKEGVDIIINGANKKFNGVMTVYGNGNQDGVEALTIKNINFVAKAGAESCIVSPDRTEQVPPTYSYSHNVTVDNCTFTDPDGVVNCAAIRHKDGGDKNWTVKKCVVDSTMHSILQVNNVVGKLTIEGCEVYSKNGANLNSCTNVEMIGCTFDVTGYAVRFGVSSGGNLGEAKTFLIKDSNLKSACDGGDAIIMFRASAVDAKLTIENTTLSGTTEVSGNTTATIITKK